jgi:hypothetical protein
MTHRGLRVTAINMRGGAMVVDWCGVPCLELVCELFDQLLLLQQYRDDDRLKRPRARLTNTGLHMELGAVEETVKDRLIPFWEGSLEGSPPATLGLNQLAERRQGLAHDMNPPGVAALKEFY